ncbi:retrovirus-related Pol polyprotein from transposon 17.6 [Trichonephila clavipes]|nr:retrovirus-related Pol polyprotein from transposon 17.6 [Trichonephila clavipes]
MKVIELKQIIVGSKTFEEEFVKNFLETVVNERMESENLEKQTLAREFQVEKETRNREFRILFQNKDIENLQLKLECLKAKQNTFVTSSQVPQFEETKYLIDTDQNSEQIELDREEVNSENKEILPPADPYSRISPVTKINSSILFAKQQNSDELALINSEVSSKTDVDACEPMPASTEGNNKLTTIRHFASKYPDVIPVSDKTSKSVIHALFQVFRRMGFSRQIHSDKGKSIMSRLTVEFFKKVNIKISKSSIFPPHSRTFPSISKTNFKSIMYCGCNFVWSKTERIY